MLDNTLRFKKKAKPHEYAIAGLKYLILIALSLFFLFPFFVLITRSLMTNKDVLTLPVMFFPSGFYFENYIKALDSQMIGYLGNTLIVVLCNIIGAPFTAAMSAFAFSKINFRFRETVFAIVLATMMLPSVVTQIPLYVTYVRIGWINTLFPFTVTAFFGGGALNIFLIRQFMRGIHREMTEAARIDGANLFMIFIRIVMPLCMPVITLIMVQTFMGVWNDFMGPLMYLRDERVYTLAIGVYSRFSGASGVDSLANVQSAVGVLMLLPCAVIFFIFQKALIEGVQIGAVKG